MSPAPATRRRTSSQDLLVLWRQYKASNDCSDRDRLVLTLAPLVKHIAYKKAREMPAHCEIEDLISCGLEALIRSLDRYDPSKGAPLEQYAWTRIHGAVLDELRRQDWAPRSVRSWQRDIAKAWQDLVVLQSRHPTRAELADALGITVIELDRRRDEIARSDVTSLNALVLADDDATIERLDTLPSDDARSNPEHGAQVMAAKDRFRAAFAQLSERERTIVVLMYVKSLTLAEVGSVVGVTESRVCQIHSDLKRKLRAALERDTDLMRLVA